MTDSEQSIGGFCSQLPVDYCKASTQCDWHRNQCIPDVVSARKTQRKDAMAGWAYFLGVSVAGLLVMAFALGQMGYNVQEMGMVGSVNVGAALLVLLVSLGVIGMLRKCNWSLGCFFLGGSYGREEQAISSMRRKGDRLAAQNSAVLRESGLVE